MTRHIPRGGFDPYVEVGPTRERVAALLAAGATCRSIAAATGLTPSGVWGVQRPDQTRVQRRTADLIAAVSLRDCIAAHTGLVPAAGTIRRIRALMALGWRHDDLAAHSGIQTHIVVSAPRRYVEARTHRAILATYDALWSTPGPSQRTRNRAAREGWPSPLAWDDETIDDPAATPWTDSAPRGAHVPGNGVVNRDSLTDCAEWGLTVSEAADRLGVSRDAIEHGITRHAPELRARFARNLAAKGVAA